MKNLMALALAAALAATLAHPATAKDADGAPVAKTAEAAAPEVKEKKICKRPETSGSRLVSRVCLTKAEWEKLESER